MIRVGYAPGFLRSFNKLSGALQQEVEERVALFEKNPQNPSLRVHKLKGRLHGRWSFSVNYQYRIVFMYEKKHTAILLEVGDHFIYE